MKGKSIKLWQAIVLVFASIFLVIGGVVLYNYLTTGFENEQVRPEGIVFGTGDVLFNSTTNQFEVDSDFALTINATNEGVSDKEITLSFAKSSSSEQISNETFVRDGVKYISNGIIAVPEIVQIGTPFNVIIEQKQYTNYEQVGSFTANVGGITTLHAKSSNILDSAGANINIAVDVPVEKIDLSIIDTSTGNEYDINDGIASILQNANFTIGVNYYPATSRYRYSDQLYATYNSVSEYTQRVKDYCFEVVSGNNVKMNYNGGDIYFSATSILGSGNNVKVYVFETAKEQEAFEAQNTTAEGENFYNVMLAYLAKNDSGVVSSKINCSIQQASIGNVYILNTNFEGKTNRLFTLTANNEKLGDGTLSLLVSDTEGSRIPAMISQVGLKVSYKKAGEVDFTPLTASDDTVVIKSMDKISVGNETGISNPYEYNGAYYYFANSSVKNLNNSYWEISTNESSITVLLEVVLFKTSTVDDEIVTEIFDEAGELLTGFTRTATITFTENLEEEGDVSWNGSLTESKSIVYRGSSQVPTELKLADRVEVPSSNTYQKVQYYIAKTLDEKGSAVDAGGNPVVISSLDANIVDGSSFEYDEKTYTLLSSSDVLFKSAGTYSIIFVTVRTDAYGNIVLDADENIVPIKISRELTVNVAKTLQQFEWEEATVAKIAENGVFKLTPDTAAQEGKSYYTFDATKNEYNLAPTPVFGAGIDYYEVSYFAIKSGTANAITLNIKVAESDCSLINKELENGKLKFYAVSADGQHELELEWVAETEKADVANGETELRVKPISLSIPDVQMNYNNGLGKGFYLVVEYDNTLEKVRTIVEMGDEAIVEQEKRCFMIYTPTPASIKNTTFIGENAIKPNDEYMPKEYYITVNMDSNAQYTECDVRLNSFTSSEILNTAGNGKEWINEQIANTIVYDAYGRFFGRDGEVKSFDLDVSQGANSAYVINDPIKGPMLEFASGEEDVMVTISSGSCSIAFTVHTRSYGLGLVTVTGGESFTTFTNVHYNRSGATTTGATVDILNVYVGQIDNATGNPKNKLNTKYFYLKDTTDTALLEMFTFLDASNQPIATADLTKKPIKAYNINSYFATGATLTFIVSNVDYSATEIAEETVRFEYKLNLEKSIEVTTNFTDSEISDGIYSALSYSLGNFMTLKTIATPVTTLSWSTNYSGIWYIDASGNITKNESAADIGTVKNGYLTFYDVTEIRNYNVKFYYYNSNNYAYHIDATFKVYPNIQFVKSTGTGALEAIDLGKLAKNDSAVTGVNNYFTIQRIKGAETLNYALTVSTLDSPVTFDTKTTFKWDSNNILSLDYNQNSMPITIKLSIDGNDVLDANGEPLTYSLDVFMFNGYEDILGTLLQYAGEPAGTIKFNNILALNVESNVQYERIKTAIDEGEYIFVSATDNNIYNIPNQQCVFVDPLNGYGFGEEYYLSIRVCSDDTGSSVIASMKVPVYVTGVGRSYAYYKDYNEANQGDNFDLNTLLFGDQDLKPYASFTAGNQIRLTYSQDDLYAKTSDTSINSGKTYYKKDVATGTYIAVTQPKVEYITSYYERKTDLAEGIYYNQTNKPSITITFENGTKDCEYGKLITKESDYFLHLSNLTSEDVFLALQVSLKKGNSNLQYTYRIKVEPNATVSTTYPFATGENAAEFVSVENSKTINLAEEHGDNVTNTGTRYNLTLGGVEIDDAQSYYADTINLVAGLNNVYTLSTGSEVYDQTGATVGTLNSNVIVEEIGEFTQATLTIGASGTYLVKTSDIIIGTECKLLAGTQVYDFTTKEITATLTEETTATDCKTQVVFSTSKYTVKEITVGGNTEDSLAGVTFNADDFVSGETYVETLTSGVTYTIAYVSSNGVNGFEIKSNEILVANITLSEDGLLELSNVNGAYFINLAIEKIYNNVIDSSQVYNMYINNINGTYHVAIEDSATTDKVEITSHSLTNLSATISKDTTFNLTTKYTVDNGNGVSGGTTQSFDDFKMDYKLKDKSGNTVDYTDALEPHTVGGTDYLLLENKASGKYQLAISLKEIITQDYVLEITFTAKNQIITTFDVDILSSLIITAKTGADQTILGGTIFNKTFILENYDLKVNGIEKTDVTLVSIDTDITELDETTNRVVATNEDVENVTIDATLQIDGGEELYKTKLTFNIQKNFTAVNFVEYGDTYYAGQEAKFDLGSFYTLVEDTTLTSDGLTLNPITIPETYRQYVKEIRFDATANAIIFVSENVGQTINGITLQLNFTYTEGNYSFDFASSIGISIEPNVVIASVYPDPDGVGGDSLSAESVYFEDEYEDFFNGTAPFADSKRLTISSLTVDHVDEDNVLVRVKDIYGVDLYAKVKSPTKEEYNSGIYYTIADGESTYIPANENNMPTGTYYYRFYPQHADTVLSGLGQTFIFLRYGSYSDGYVTFEIEYNAVVHEYKVNVFNDIIDMTVLNSVNSVGGEEEIFLEQLSYGNILAEKMVARVTMDPSMQSGTYYIKVSNGNNSVNPFHWAGFDYDSSVGNTFYVFLGEQGRLDEDVVNGTTTAVKGDIIGIFGSKNSTTDAKNYLKDGEAVIELTSFVNINYKTIENDVLTTVIIDRASHEYTSVIEALKNGSTTSSVVQPLFKYNNKWCTVDGDNEPVEVSINTSLLNKVILGTYDVYDNYVDLTSGENVFVSKFEDTTITSGLTGFGQNVELVGKLGASSTKVYSYQQNNGETIYVVNSESNNTVVGTVYSNNENIRNENVNEYQANADNVAIGFEITSDLEAVTGSNYYKYTGDSTYDYYFNKNLVVYEDFTGYKKVVGDARSALDGNVITNLNTIDSEIKGIDGSTLSLRKFTVDGTEYYIYDKEGDLSAPLTIDSGHHIYYADGVTFVNTKVDDVTFINSVGVADNSIEIGDVRYLVGNFTVGSFPVDIKVDATAKWTAKVNKTATNVTASRFMLNEDEFNGKAILVLPNGTQYLANGSQDYILSKTTSEGILVVMADSSATVYRSITTKYTFSDAITSIGSTTKIDGTDYYRVDSKYIKASDVNTYQYEGTNYLLASNETFNINNIESLVVGDSVEVKFQFILGEHIKEESLKFKLYVDLMVQNSVFSENADETKVGVLTNIEDGISTTYNYVEVETNKTYNFNEIVGVNKISTGDVINISDVYSTTNINITIMKGDEEEFTNNAQLKKLKEFLGEEFKTNTSDLVRFSAEHKRTQDNESGIVYNFDIVPIGADNNGDYVIVKYEYSISVGDCYFVDTDSTQYTVTDYVLFKLLPDYKVAMNDINGNSILVTTSESTVNNASNPIEFNDFSKLGDMVKQDKTLAEKFSLSGEVDIMPINTASTTFPSNIVYKYGYGMATSGGTGKDLYTAVIINSATYYVLTASCGGEGNNKIDTSTNYAYENVLINLNYQNSTNTKLLAITAQNAVNSTRDVSARVFDAELSELTLGDIDNYLSTDFSEFTGKAVAKNNGGVRLKVTKDLYLGRRDFIMTYTDAYGFKVEVYFSLIASSDPAYATGLLEFTEGSTFDLGAQYEVVNATQYKIDTTAYYNGLETFYEGKDLSSELYYLDLSVKKGDKLGEGYYKAVRAETETTDSGTYDYTSYGTTTDNSTYCDEDSTQTNGSSTNLVERAHILRLRKQSEIIIKDKYGNVISEGDNKTGKWYKLESVSAGTEVKDDPNVDADGDGTVDADATCYFRKLEYVTATSGVKSALNLPYGLNKAPTSDGTMAETNLYGALTSRLYLSNNVYVNLYSSFFKASQVSATVTQPKDPTITDPETSAYVDTIELSGIRAYGFNDIFTAHSDIKTLKYFDATVNDIENIKITNIDLLYDNQVVENVYNNATGKTLASSSSVYKYSTTTETKDGLVLSGTFTAEKTIGDSSCDYMEYTGSCVATFEDYTMIYPSEMHPTDSMSQMVFDTMKQLFMLYVPSDKISEGKIPVNTEYYKLGTVIDESKHALGRDPVENNFKIPVLPGWVYGKDDYAYVTMNITLQYSKDSITETYVVPIQIRVTKGKDRVISENTKATNVSDGISFALQSHIKDAADFTFYDDTIAVTLPAQAGVTLEVKAYDKSKTYYTRSGTEEPYTYTQVTTFKPADFANYYVQNSDGSYSLATIKPDFKGSTTLSSSFREMDSTQYVGLSALVGRTLGPDYYVEINFSNYDLTKVTRNGNFGFYASYNNGAYITASGGNEEIITTTKDAGFVYGYGKTQAEGGSGEFTLINISGVGNLVVVPTESIEYVVGGTSRVKAGTRYIPKDDFENSASLTEPMTISSWATIARDTLRIVDMGHLSDGKEVVTKYYLAQFNGEEVYQFVKNYNVYPTITNIETDDVNNRVYANAEEYEDSDEYYYFDISTWANQVTIYQYANSSSSGLSLDNIDRESLYFEIGDKGTTSAEIDEDGTISVKSSEYLLDGSRFVTVNIYVKASGENGKYIDDNLPYSGNDYNSSVISIKVYLKDTLEGVTLSNYELMLERVAKLEELADDFTKTNVTSYDKRQLTLMYIRQGTYTGNWNTLAGESPTDFSRYVEENSDCKELQSTASVTPTTEAGAIDFIHFIATLNMHMAPDTSQNKQDLGGWAGDLAQLIQSINGKENAESLAESLMGSESDSTTFGDQDYRSDLDAIGVAKKLEGSSLTIAGAIETYYAEYTNRSVWFLKDVLGYTYDDGEGKTFAYNQTELANKVKERMEGNKYIVGDTVLGVHVSGLYDSYGIDIAADVDYINAACSAFAKYVLEQCGYTA